MKQNQLKIQTTNEIFNYMKSLGYKKIGEGGSSLVFAKDQKDFVVKIYEYDKCYEQFLKLAFKNQKNPFFPKFYNKIYFLPGNKYKAVKMEKLKPVSISDLKKYLPFLANLALFQYEKSKNFGPGLSDTLMTLGYFSDDLEQIKKLSTKATPLEKQTAKQIIDLVEKSNCNNDLWITNFMNRNGHLVVVDPLAIVSE